MEHEQSRARRRISASKARVNRDRVRAHGTCSIRTPQRRHLTRRSTVRIRVGTFQQSRVAPHPCCLDVVDPELGLAATPADRRGAGRLDVDDHLLGRSRRRSRDAARGVVDGDGGARGAAQGAHDVDSRHKAAAQARPEPARRKRAPCELGVQALVVCPRHVISLTADPAASRVAVHTSSRSNSVAAAGTSAFHTLGIHASRANQHRGGLARPEVLSREMT